jgi:threonine/homoserine/homoserine lactone efflux protein
LGDAIGQVLPLAVGVALSPLPIIGVVLMLVTPHGRLNGIAFVAGWLAGLALVGIVVLVVAPGARDDDGTPATWVGVLELVLGALLLTMALRRWRGRPRDGRQEPAPRWMEAIDTFGPAKALGAGAVLSAANPKNLLLAVAAAASIAQAAVPAREEAIAYAVFVVIGTVGVAAPVVIAFALGDRSGPVLERLRSWMAGNNAVIMAVLLLVIGAKLLGDGIGALT